MSCMCINNFPCCFISSSGTHPNRIRLELMCFPWTMVGSTDSVRIIVTFLTEDSIDTTTAMLTLSTENCLVADHALVDDFFYMYLARPASSN